MFEKFFRRGKLDLRISSLLLVGTVLFGGAFLLQITVSAQTTYITVYGQLDYYQCPTTTYTNTLVGSCQNFFFLATNDTTPGIPNYPRLDFSQSVVPAPSQSDVGKVIAVIGYYVSTACAGDVSPVEGCQVLQVHVWGPYYGPSALPTTPGCFSSSNPPTTWVSVQCVTAPTIPLGGATAQGLTPAYHIGLFSLTAPLIIIVVLVLAFLGYIFTHRKK